MTNYNERRDKIFETLNNKAREERASCIERNNWEGYNSSYERLESEAKQAITSLIKELVAEAQPTRSETQIGNLIIYGDLSKRDLNIINQFEQNLLKGLEEV